MAKDIYERLAVHLSTLQMGYPIRDELQDILRELFTPKEAEVALALPTRVIPLQPVGADDIIGKVKLPREELVGILERLWERGLLYSGRTKEGERAYALLQRGFGFPQTFFWKGESTPYAKKMADLIGTYMRRKVDEELHGMIETKAFQFIPMNEAIKPEMQAVYPYTMLEKVVEQAGVIAVAHCPCRMRTQIQGRGCDHLLEVCLKFDELAEYLIEKELGREVTKEEALQIIRKAEEDGLVHFVDNALGDIKHNCNCCDCCCWALSPIRERRIPRDLIMATYFIRQTDEENCTGCGDCVDICPVDALTIENNLAVVAEDWCVGCGLCITHCSTSTARLRKKSDRIPAPDFRELHEKMLEDKGFK